MKRGKYQDTRNHDPATTNVWHEAPKIRLYKAPSARELMLDEMTHFFLNSAEKPEIQKHEFKQINDNDQPPEMSPITTESSRAPGKLCPTDALVNQKKQVSFLGADGGGVRPRVLAGAVQLKDIDESSESEEGSYFGQPTTLPTQLLRTNQKKEVSFSNGLANQKKQVPFSIAKQNKQVSFSNGFAKQSFHPDNHSSSSITTNSLDKFGRESITVDTLMHEQGGPKARKSSCVSRPKKFASALGAVNGGTDMSDSNNMSDSLMNLDDEELSTYLAEMYEAKQMRKLSIFGHLGKKTEDIPMLSQKAKSSRSLSLFGKGGGRIDEEGNVALPLDTYSFLYLKSWKSKACFVTFFTIAIQLVCLVLVVFELSVKQNEERYGFFNVPPVMVDKTVIFGQLVAIWVAVMVNDDVTESILMFSVGHHKTIGEQYPDATYYKFMICQGLRLFEGLSLIFISFLFIVQSETVLDIFLDFVAVQFVGSLDDIGFMLAENGWFGIKLLKFCQSMEDVRFETPKDKKTFWERVASMILLLFTMYTAYFVVVQNQLNGDILNQNSCRNVWIRFGEHVYGLSDVDVTIPLHEYNDTTSGLPKKKLPHSTREVATAFNGTAPPDIVYAYFSGRYEANFKDLILRRPTYYERGESDIASGMFYYCKVENAWVFTIRAFKGTGILPKQTEVDCEHGWLMRSEVTDAATLDRVPPDGWQIWNGALKPADGLKITCGECQSDLDCGDTRNGKCVNRGATENVNAVCECKNNRDGTFCEYERPCDELVWYMGSGNYEEPVVPYITMGNIEEFNNTLPRAYERPVYLKYTTNNQYEAVLYTGVRWNVLQWDNSSEFPFTDKDSFSNFHAYWGNILVANSVYFSEATDKAVPSGPLHWLRLSGSMSAGDYGLYGRYETAYRQFECFSVNCQRHNVCGIYGNCRDNVNLYPIGQTKSPPNNSAEINFGKMGAMDEETPENAVNQTIDATETGTEEQIHALFGDYDFIGGKCECAIMNMSYYGHYCEYRWKV